MTQIDGWSLVYQIREAEAKGQVVRAALLQRALDAIERRRLWKAARKKGVVSRFDSVRRNGTACARALVDRSSTVEQPQNIKESK